MGCHIHTKVTITEKQFELNGGLFMIKIVTRILLARLFIETHTMKDDRCSTTEKFALDT